MSKVIESSKVKDLLFSKTFLNKNIIMFWHQDNQNLNIHLFGWKKNMKNYSSDIKVATKEWSIAEENPSNLMGFEPGLSG